MDAEKSGINVEADHVIVALRNMLSESQFNNAVLQARNVQLEKQVADLANGSLEEVNKKIKDLKEGVK